MSVGWYCLSRDSLLVHGKPTALLVVDLLPLIEGHNLPGQLAISHEHYHQLARYFKDLIGPHKKLAQLCDIQVVYAIPIEKRYGLTHWLNLRDADDITRSYPTSHAISFIHDTFAAPLGAKLAKTPHHFYKNTINYNKLSHINGLPITQIMSASLSHLPLVGNAETAISSTSLLERLPSGIYWNVLSDKIRSDTIETRLEHLAAFMTDHRLVFIDLAPLASTSLTSSESYALHLSPEMMTVLTMLSRESAHVPTRLYTYNSQHQPEVTADLAPQLKNQLKNQFNFKGPIGCFSDWEMLDTWVQSRFNYRMSHLKDGKDDLARRPQCIYLTENPRQLAHCQQYFGEPHLRGFQHTYLNLNAQHTHCPDGIESVFIDEIKAMIRTEHAISTSRDSGLDGTISPPPSPVNDITLFAASAIDESTSTRGRVGFHTALRRYRRKPDSSPEYIPTAMYKLFSRDDRPDTIQHMYEVSVSPERAFPNRDSRDDLYLLDQPLQYKAGPKESPF